MRPTGIGRLLLGIGMGVGVVAGVALMVGFEPSRLPAALLNIAAYKLAFGAALGLLVAGAAVIRYGRGAGLRGDDAITRRAEPPRLGEAIPQPSPVDSARPRERVREPRA